MSIDQEEKIADPSFGMIRISRVSGRRELFGVDYEQDHYIELTITGGVLYRSLSHDRFFDQGEKIKIAMSEVQYARMISSPNTSGTPCTIAREWVDGKYVSHQTPPKHMADAEKFVSEIEGLARQSADHMTEALKKLDAMLAPGGKITKGELQELRDEVRNAGGRLTGGLGFVVKTAQEAVVAATEHGKAETDAYIQHQLAALGGETLREALADGRTKGGVMLRIGGRMQQPEVPLVESE